MRRGSLLVLVCTVSLVAAWLPAEEKKEPAGESKVTLKEGTWKDVLKRVEASKGKIVIVDAWSTSCAPCKKEFPSLVKIHETHGKDVVCISISLDYQGIKSKPPAYYRERVQKFLTEKNATFDNYLCTDPADDVYTEIGVASIPTVLVYGRDGKLSKRFDNDNIGPNLPEFTYKDVNKLLDMLLAKK